MSTKIWLAILLLLGETLLAGAQEHDEKDFEGLIVFRTSVVSRIPGISDAAWADGILTRDSMQVYLRHGFIRRSSPDLDEYFNPVEEKIYIKIKGVDTLFYRNYLFDSSNHVVNVRTNPVIEAVNRINCQQLTVETDQAVVNYWYTPSMHLDPAYAVHNTLARYDTFAQITRAYYLKSEYITSSNNFIQTATRVVPQTLDESLFNTPALPVRPYSFFSIGTAPTFKGGEKAYIRFMQKNLDGGLAKDHLPVPEGEKKVSQTIKLRVITDEKGKIQLVEVLNKAEVNARLAEEAVRVTQKLPDFKPATMLGKPIPFQIITGVTFENYKK